MKVKIISYSQEGRWEAVCKKISLFSLINPLEGYGLGSTRQEAIADAINSFKRQYLKRYPVKKEKFKLELEI